MTVRTLFSWLVFLAVLLVVWVLYRVHSNETRVVNIASWDNGTRTLHLAAPMPSCACLSMSTKPRSTQNRFHHLVEELKAFRLPNDPLPNPDEIVLVSRLNNKAIGQTFLFNRTTHVGKSQGWAFAFDWAGSMIGSDYDIQAYGAKIERDAAGKITSFSVDDLVGPLDMDALFDMEAVEQTSCDDLQNRECPWNSLNLNKAFGEHIGQNDVESSFTGARIARADRVIQAQATGRLRGAPGDCACMLLEVMKVPFTLRAAIESSNRGLLKFTKPGELLAIPFDYAGPRGDQFYELNIDGDSPVTDYLRLLGQLDGMSCDEKAAVFSMASATAVNPVERMLQDDPGYRLLTDPAAQHAYAAAFVNGAARTLTCPYHLDNPDKGIEGQLSLLFATNADEKGANPQLAKPTSVAPALPPPARGAAPTGVKK